MRCSTSKTGDLQVFAQQVLGHSVTGCAFGGVDAFALLELFLQQQ